MILAAGLTPAWQQIATLDALSIGQVNRAREFTATASGKVINVGLALHSLRAPSMTLSFIGGAAGAAIKDEFAAKGVPSRWIDTDSPTRVCTTLLDESTGVATELVENSAPVSESELETFLAAFKEASGNADVVVLSGSLPQGAPPDFHARLMQSVGNPQARFILDISGPPLLHALKENPFLVKPNREELARTLDRELAGLSDLKEAMLETIRLGAEWCVVTDGDQAAHATDGDSFLSFSPVPDVDVVNPIGCGDCFAAGLALEISVGGPMIAAFQTGMGAAAMNLQDLLPARLDRDLVKRLSALVDVREV